MRLAVLGASGGCGRWVIMQGLERGHQLTAVVRPETEFPDFKKVAIIRGSVLDRPTIDQAVQGQDAVISCLGVKRKNPKNPWSEVISPHDLTTRVTGHLIDAMNSNGVKRLVAISAAGVAESKPHCTWLMRFMIDHSNVGVAYRDLEGMEKLLRESDLDWMAVRPAALTDSPTTGRAGEIDYFGIRSKISRADVAQWLLDAVEQPEPLGGETPMIAYG